MLASVGLFASGWPAFIATHAWIVWMVAGTGLAVFAAGFLVPSKEKSESPAEFLGSGNLVGRDNSGKMIAHVEHYHEAPSQPAPEPAKQEPPSYALIDIVPPKPPPQLRLELNFELTSLVYKVENSAWDEATEFDYDRREALIAWFTNPVPPKGVTGVDASRLSAHIRYSAESHWSTQVSRGYWLRHSANEIAIDAADRAGLILGLVDWSHWVSYANPYRRPASEEFLQPALRHPGEQKRMPKADMEIDVSLLSCGTTTLDNWKLFLTFTNDRPYVVRV
jgi:hypothetical protein